MLPVQSDQAFCLSLDSYVCLREATDEDMQEITELLLYLTSRATLPKEESPPSLPHSSIILVAELELNETTKKIVGLIGIHFWNSIRPSQNKTSAYLHDFVVHPDFRGKGIGKALIEKALKLSEEKASKLHLACSTETKGFYEQYGFAPVATTMVKYPSSHDTLENS